MKCCQIYKTNKSYKIVTMYRLESWSYIASFPIFILPLQSSGEELADKIFESLKNSRSLLESEEDDFWLGNKLLKEIKESSFNKLYQNSKSCTVYMEGANLEIEPNNYLGPDKGLEPLTDEVVKINVFNNSKIEVTNCILKVLD